MLRVLSLFSGIGSFEKALSNTNTKYELINFCEIDKYAIKGYSTIHKHSEDLNLGDISKVNEHSIRDFDLMTYGYPCQDLSVAGQGKGIIKGETRSGLLYEALRIARHKMPKYMIAENVKNLFSKKFLPDFQKIITELDEMGYNNYFSILNAKDYEVAQSRERVFVVSIRKDIDTGFSWPTKSNHSVCLNDILEDEVDEKYYIPDRIARELIKQFKKDYLEEGIYPVITPSRLTKRQNGRRFRDVGDPMFTLTTQDRHGIMVVGSLDIKGIDQIKRVYHPAGLSPTLTTMQGGNRQPKIIEESLLESDFRIRKLTPLECFRLMGFSDDDFNQLKKVGISNSQLYKMAGNSICVPVLEGIITSLLSNSMYKSEEIIHP